MRRSTERGVHWLKPELVAEIEFAGWTGDGMVRQAAFKGLREDKPAEEVEAEKPAPAQRPKLAEPPRRRRPSLAARRQRSMVMGVAISQSGQGAVAGRRRRQAGHQAGPGALLRSGRPWMMPHIKGRPCSIVRAPDGIGGEHFFQRHAMQGTSSLLAGDGVRRPQALSADRPHRRPRRRGAGGGVELHPWNCEPRQPDLPGRLVFDLDPGARRAVR